MARQWRLIWDAPTEGARNMAVDEALLASVASGDSVPVLRLYQWSPPCLSLGYGQRAADADLERIHAFGWQLVRRPTGGRAILHTDELTYSVSLPADHALVEGDVVQSYRRISEALLAALRILGAQPQAEPAKDSKSGIGPVCFETPSHYEITVGGRKLIGSAQVRRKEYNGGVLQHGTLPLYGDISRICDALTYAHAGDREEAKAQVQARALTLETALGYRVTWEEAAEAVIQGFQDTFDLELVDSALSPDEAEHAAQLTTEVFGHETWTFKR
ncbi:MAG: biotin/lipoate A/B protein ligase family protein [Anaerolineae bacterium]